MIAKIFSRKTQHTPHVHSNPTGSSVPPGPHQSEASPPINKSKSIQPARSFRRMSVSYNLRVSGPDFMLIKYRIIAAQKEPLSFKISDGIFAVTACKSFRFIMILFRLSKSVWLFPKSIRLFATPVGFSLHVYGRKENDS